MSEELRQEIILGEQARDLMANPAFTAAITALEEKIIKEWRLCSPDDPKKAEKLHVMIQLVPMLQNEIYQLIGAGINANETLEFSKHPERTGIH
jgi:hypothetical protein